MGEVATVGFGRWIAHDEADRRLEAFVRGLTYEDGWEFVLGRDELGRDATFGRNARSSAAFIAVTWTVADVLEPGGQSLLTGRIIFRPEMGDDGFRMLVYDLWRLISELEAHERIEQLRVDGRPIWDPHPSGSRNEPLVCAPDWAELPACLSRVPA